jgi:hypothetical protein
LLVVSLIWTEEIERPGLYALAQEIGSGRITALRYIMSFAIGGLFRQESVEITLLYLEFRDWNKVYENIHENNFLQARTMSTLKRICSEICSRLKTLNESELEFLVNGTNQEQNYLLWLAICRRYHFIQDFAVEVIRERYLTLRPDLNYEDFDAFFNAKAEWHYELEKIKDSTRRKLRQVLFRMLREADLLTSSNTIIPAMLSSRFVSAVSRSAHQELLVFPAMESELKRRVQ